MSDFLPASVRRQAEEAAALEAQLAQPTPEPAPSDQPTDPPAEVAPAQAPAVQQPPAPTQPQPDPWEQRYRTLQGILDAEQKRNREQSAELQGQLTDTLARLKSLETAQAQPAEPTKPVVSADEVEAFGAETIDLMRRIAADVFRQMPVANADTLDKLIADVADLRKQVGGVQQDHIKTVEDRFWEEFRSLVPDYEAVNADRRFLDWLAAKDPMAGVERQQFLNAAFSAANARQAAEVFKGWMRSVGWGEAPAAPAPQVEAPSTASELEAQVAPGGSRSGVDFTFDVTGTRIWTGAEINAAFAEMTKGKMTRVDVERLQSEIDLALAQGRVKP